MPIPSYFFADLVRETSSSTGIGALTLSGALPGHRSFLGTVPSGVDFCYAIAGISTPAEWEVGIGQINAQGQLVRANILSSSAGGALVPFTQGLKTVALTVAANWYSAVGAPPVIADVAGLQTALDAKVDDSQVSAFGATLVDDADAATARATLGLGTMATQSAAAVAITGGAISGLSDLGIETISGVSMTLKGRAGDNAAQLRFLDAAGTLSTIIAQVGTDLRFFTASTVERLRLDALGTILPGADNAQDFGSASLRLKTMYAATGTINTSDEREKTWRGGLNAAEIAAAKEIVREIGLFQWNDAIADKGADANAGGARLHAGVRAQQVWGIMARHGLVDPIGVDGKPGKTPYAFLCWNEWRDPKDKRRKVNRYGVRTDQLALFIIAAIARTMEGEA